MKFDMKKIILFLIAILVAILFHRINPLELTTIQSYTLSVLIFMLTLWFTESFPIGIVALTPLIVFPLLSISSMLETIKNYYDPVVFLFFGGFLLGLGIEKWNLHKRIALSIVKITGTSPNKIILGISIATAFLSMWLSNTATTMMMFPIAMSVISLLNKDNIQSKGMKNFSLVMMLMIAYASNIGGIATIIGTPPNVVFKGIMQKQNITINFIDWSMLCFPLAILLLGFTYVILTYILYPNKISATNLSKEIIHDEYKKLGKMTTGEKIVTLIFSITCLFWVFNSQVSEWLELTKDEKKLYDPIVAMIGGTILFFIPAKLKEYKMTLHIRDLKKMQWGILLLFGGGLALANAMETSGLMNLVGENVKALNISSTFLFVLVLTTLAIFLSELMSNVALVTVFVPVVLKIAVILNLNPILLAIPVTLGASCAFMLPMGTPPNAIVYASGKIKMKQMATAGFILNIISALFISMMSYFLIELVFT